MEIFICPKCKSPHFGSYNHDANIVYCCHGNEWKDYGGCGWQGDYSECFLDKTIEEVQEYNKGWNKHVL